MNDDSPFARACSRPFANGTEGHAWMATWCEYCARDHGMHNGNDQRPMCDLIGSTMCDPDSWPEGWVPEPDDGDFYLPSRIVCLAFTPCEACGGDPGATERAERIEAVTAYWRDRS